MIRLGSLAGYPFEGPRLLAGWTPPSRPAVFAILCKPEPEAKPDKYAVIYAGHSDDLATERFPFSHPRASCWVRRAPRSCRCTPSSGNRSHREQITRELIAIYHPSCNEQQYDNAWRDEWIGEYSAPTTGPVARRGPDGGDPSLCS